jgi:CheY-like chemotaxis protein
MPDCDGAGLGRIIINDDILESTRLILLTSSGQRGEGQLFADIGFAAYLLKPVAQRDLTLCLMQALASEADTWRTHTQPIITRHALRAQRPHFLEKYLPGTYPDAGSAAQEPPVDWESLLDSFGGDTAFARKLVELFVSNGIEPALAERLKDEMQRTIAYLQFKLA